MGTGHGHGPEFAHGNGATVQKDSVALVGRAGIPSGCIRCEVTTTHIGVLGGDLLDRPAVADRLHGGPGLELEAALAAYSSVGAPVQGHHPASDS